MRAAPLVTRFAAVLGLLCTATVHAADPLPSWNDGPSKQSIVRFVEQVATKGSATFVAAAERIATFDDDGTLVGRAAPLCSGVFAMDQIGRAHV